MVTAEPPSVRVEFGGFSVSLCDPNEEVIEATAMVDIEEQGSETQLAAAEHYAAVVRADGSVPAPTAELYQLMAPARQFRVAPTPLYTGRSESGRTLAVFDATPGGQKDSERYGGIVIVEEFESGWSMTESVVCRSTINADAAAYDAEIQRLYPEASVPVDPDVARANDEKEADND